MQKVFFQLWNAGALLISLSIIVLSYLYLPSLDNFDAVHAFKEYAFNGNTSVIIPSLWLPIVVAIISFTIAAIANPYRRSTAYGSAHWARLKDIAKMQLLAPAGLIIAIYAGRYIRYDKDLSALLIAPPGTGKTSAVVIPILMSEKRSMIVHDVKDELFDLTSARRAQMGKVIRFAPVSDDTHCFNPFAKEFIKPVLEENIALIDQVGSMLIKDDGGSETKVDHWIRDGRNLFKMYTLYLIWKDGFTTLPKVRELALSDPEPQELLHDIIDDEADQMPQELALLFNRNAGKPDKEFGSVHSTMTSFLDIFSDPRIKRTFSNSDFKVSDIRNECTTLYLHVPVTDIARLSPLLSMVLEVIGNHLLSGKRTSDQQRVLFLLDEFVWLGKMPSMIKLPSLSRGEGASVLFVCQSYSQIQGLYGKSAVDTLKGTCAYRIILPQNEEETAESIAKAVGDETRIRKSTSHSDSGTSKSLSGEGHKLIRAQELLSMKEMECIILAQNHFQTPIRAKQCRWYADKNMKTLAGKVDINFKALRQGDSDD